MIQSTKIDIQAALYGIARLVAGYHDWEAVKSTPAEKKILVLAERTGDELREIQSDILNLDPKRQNQVLRKLRAYQQLLLLEKFIFEEVDWEE